MIYEDDTKCYDVKENSTILFSIEFLKIQYIDVHHILTLKVIINHSDLVIKILNSFT